jgi:two-component system sensor histidine kinase PilS (NtrC family)
MRLILARDAARRSACVQLCDGGSGVPAEHHDAIFEPFFTTAASGSGLGLYAARALAEANGARLEYRPGARAGACFTLTFAA